MNNKYNLSGSKPGIYNRKVYNPMNLDSLVMAVAKEYSAKYGVKLRERDYHLIRDIANKIKHDGKACSYDDFMKILKYNVELQLGARMKTLTDRSGVSGGGGPGYATGTDPTLYYIKSLDNIKTDLQVLTNTYLESKKMESASGGSDKLENMVYDISKEIGGNKEFESIVVTVDSTWRDALIYPHSSDFSLSFNKSQNANKVGFINFNKTLTNVTSIKLINAQIPHYFTPGTYYEQPLFLNVNEIPRGNVYNTVHPTPIYAELYFDYPTTGTQPLRLKNTDYKYGSKFPQSSEIPSLSSITVQLSDRFGNKFLPDVLIPDAVNISNITQSPLIVTDTRITTTTAHGFDVGDRVFFQNISGATDGVTPLPGVNAELMKYSGFEVTNNVSSTIFEIDYDLSSYTALVPFGLNGRCINLKKQCVFTFEIQYRITEK